MEGEQRLRALGDRYVAELFAFDPGAGRTAGDHSFDGQLGPVGADAVARRLRAIDDLAAEVGTLAMPGDAEGRADLISLRHRLALERFETVELDGAHRNPLQLLFRGADPQPYAIHDYAPVPQRADGLCRHLELLPDWLDAAAGQLGEVLDGAPRSIAIDVARGLASFYRDDLDASLPLPGHPELQGRLRAAADGAALACERFASAVEDRSPDAASPLGEARFVAYLAAQEGVTETAANLRASADAELDRLGAEFDAVAGPLEAGDGAAAAALLADDHPTAAGLVDEAAASLDRLRQFWIERDVVGIPEGRCSVMPSPAFLRFLSAAFFGSGTLAAPEVTSVYIVTSVSPEWSEAEADEWLRSMNRNALENIGVHEVYPGHFVHERHALEAASLLRRQGWVAGFGEGWAHYTEQLAIEQGLAEGRPLLHLAQLQDALLRACRFRAALALHTEGANVDDATAIFMRHARLSHFPAEREARRGTFDPLYLVYTYGKQQILEWRAAAERAPGFSLRAFHDRLLRGGYMPLAAARELALPEEQLTPRPT